jgi:hypothetical protein
MSVVPANEQRRRLRDAAAFGGFVEPENAVARCGRADHDQRLLNW